jgi:hypothetical protein
MTLGDQVMGHLPSRGLVGISHCHFDRLGGLDDAADAAHRASAPVSGDCDLQGERRTQAASWQRSWAAVVMAAKSASRSPRPVW